MGAQLGIERTPTSHFVTLNCEAVVRRSNLSKLLLVVLEEVGGRLLFFLIGEAQ